MTKNRHGLPKKRPLRPARADIADELPALEPSAGEPGELSTPKLFEPEQPAEPEPPAAVAVEAREEVASEIADGPVRISCADGREGFDTTLTVIVPAMPKAEMAAAVSAPLRRLLDDSEPRIRHKRVLVRFPGDTMIPSAMKAAVAEAVRPKKPLLVTLHRGFGAEVVFEGALPQVAFAARDEEDVIRVHVSTGDIDPRDLPVALAPHLSRLAETARDRRFTFQFTGAAKPDDAVRGQVEKALRDAHAARLTIGDRLVFDRELFERVQVVESGEYVDVKIRPFDDEAAAVQAVTTVLTARAELFAHKVARLSFGKEPRSGEREAAIESCKTAGAHRIELHGILGEPDVVWPKLIHIVGGRETTLHVHPNGRSRAAVMAAFVRECVPLRAAITGMSVAVDWPAGFSVDAEIERICLRGALGSLSPRTLSCTIGGDLREPFLPPPVEVATAGAQITVTIHSEAGKPPELQRAVDRRLQELAEGLRGKSLRVCITGGAALSRTFQRSTSAIAEAAGAARLELDDHGDIDVVLPPMLGLKRAGGEVRIVVAVEGRDTNQQQRALQRELDAAGALQDAVIRMSSSAATDTVVAALVARGAARVVLDGPAPVQVHPTLFGAPEKKGQAVHIAARGGGDAAMVERQLQREMPLLLAGLAPATKEVMVAWPGIRPSSAPFARLVEGLLGKNVGRILLDSGTGEPVLVHPPVAASAPAAIEAPAAATAPAAPATAATPAAPAAPAAPATPATPAARDEQAPCITLLARKDDSVPPMVVLGVEVGADAAHMARVEAEVQRHLAALRGRCVLLVLREGDLELPVRREDAFVKALCSSVATAAAATLLFRGPDAQQRPHFPVAHSRIRAFPFGATFADPRRAN